MTIERPGPRQILAYALSLSALAAAAVSILPKARNSFDPVQNAIFNIGDQLSAGTYQSRIMGRGFTVASTAQGQQAKTNQPGKVSDSLFSMSDQVSTETMSCLSNIGRYAKAWRCSTPYGKVFDTDNVTSAMGRTSSLKGQKGPAL